MHAVCLIIKTECAFGAAARAAIFAGVQPSRLKYFVTIRNQPSYAGKKISRVIREIFCNNKEASA